MGQHTLVIILKLTTTYCLKPHLNHPGQRRVTQACDKYLWQVTEIQ